MSDDPKLKRRILAQAVQENLDVIQGVRRTARQKSRRRAVTLAAASAGVVVALGVTGWFVWGRPADVAPPEVVPSQVTESRPPRPRPAGALTPPEARPQPGEMTPDIFPLAVRRVVLDPGHGGSTEGAMSSPRHGARLREKDLALDIAQRARALLEAAGFEVIMTRDQDHNVDLRERAELANRATGDVFLSIHLNWIEGRRGVETYYLGAAADPALSRLAAAENGESGYSMSDLRRLLDGVYTHLRGAESKELAESVQHELHRELAEVNPELRDRGVKTAPFVVLINTEMPAILAEVSDLADPREVTLLRSNDYRDRIAGALAAGVRRYADSVSTTRQKGDAG